MGYRKPVRVCRNPHKGMRVDTSARALYNSHRSCFGPKSIRKELTERQQAIYDGTLPEPKKWDIVTLIKKFEHFEMFEEAAKIYDMYGYFFHEIEDGDPTFEEAEAILDLLTPDDLK